MNENEKLELKEKVTDGLSKEVVAFANTRGGDIHVGIRDDGTLIGVENVDTSLLQISNMIRDGILPDVTMFIKYSSYNQDDKNILKLEVAEGTNKPYYLKAKGLKPSGVYVRQGSSSAPASIEAIRKMIKETDGTVFERMRSLEQDLHFSSVKEVFKSRKLPFDTNKFSSLHLVNKDGEFNNLAFLLSDENVSTVKMGVFQNSTTIRFNNREEFKGSILTQVQKILDALAPYNFLRSEIEDFVRHDYRDYPNDALREAVFNMIMHRDYSIHASSAINVYSDRIEFISPGGLVEEMAEDDLFTGVSFCRNENLGNILYRLGFVETYGTGLIKIRELYKNSERKPEVRVSTNTFTLVLPKVTVENKDTSSLNPLETAIYNLLETGDVFTRKEILEKIDTPSSTLLKALKKLVDEGFIQKLGSGRSTRYQKK